MESKGWIKLHRKILNSEIMRRDGEAFKLWVWLLGKAAHKPQTVYGHHLEAGQLLFKYSDFLNDTAPASGPIKECLKPRHIRWHMDWLTARHMVRRKKVYGASIVTICNYLEYQGTDSDKKDAPVATTVATTVATPVATPTASTTASESLRSKEVRSKNKNLSLTTQEVLPEVKEITHASSARARVNALPPVTLGLTDAEILAERRKATYGNNKWAPEDLEHLKARFKELWKAYPRKEGGTKPALNALLCVEGLTDELINFMLMKLELFPAHLKRTYGQDDWKRFCPYMENWLAKECWNDDYSQPKKKMVF